MALTIRTTGIEDYLSDGDAFIKALILGPPSAGKTRSASFWPKPIFADCEKGRMSIADRKMPYGEVLSQRDMKDLIRMLRIECMKPVASRKYQTFVVDTLDSFQRIVIQERLKETQREAMTGWEDWGYLDTKMTAFISDLLSLPMNIVVNLHVKDTKDGDDGPLVTGPKLKGDLRDQIAAEFDLVGLMGVHYHVEGGDRVLKRSIKWHPEPSAPMLKDRSGRLPKTTNVTFTEDDYSGLFVPLIDALDHLQASVELERIGDEDYAPVEPHASGAVAQPQAAPVSPAKRAPAKKAAAAVTPAVKPAVTPAAAVATPPAAAVPPVKAVPAAKRPTIEVVDTNVPPAPKPKPETGGAGSAPPAAAPAGVDPATGVVDPAFIDTAAAGPDVTEQQGIDNAVEGLGGKVTQEVIHPDEDPPVQPAATPVPAAAPAAPTGTQVCGVAGRNRDGTVNENPVPGCGTNLADIKPDLVNISLIKTMREKRPTYLCPACMAAHKATS